MIIGPNNNNNNNNNNNSNNNNNNNNNNNKRVKYNDLATTHIFVPIAVETSGAWCSQSAQFIEDLGRRICAVTNEPLETT